jgi:hypothetical protein
MMLGDIANQEAFLRTKLQEKQQAAELQQAIDLQSRRFMGLQLLDLNKRSHYLGSTVGSPMPLGQTDGKGNAVHLTDVTIQGAGPVLDLHMFLGSVRYLVFFRVFVTFESMVSCCR